MQQVDCPKCATKIERSWLSEKKNLIVDDYVNYPRLGRDGGDIPGATYEFKDWFIRDKFDDDSEAKFEDI